MLLNRELSWLDLNARVLDLAGDPNEPLLERVKFCGIFSSDAHDPVRSAVACFPRSRRRVAHVLIEQPGQLARRTPAGRAVGTAISPPAVMQPR